MAKKPSRAAKTEAPAAAAIDNTKLRAIVEATVAGGFVYCNADEVAAMVAAELVETNATMTDEAGNIATRATPKGIETMNQTATEAAPVAAAATEAPKASRLAIEIDDYVPATRNKRGGGKGGELYPFEALEVGKSFHVANTSDKPDVAKALASTVSSATARYAVGTGEFEDVTVPVYQLDAEGKRVKDAEGHYVKTGEETERREVMRKTRVFRVQRVGAEDPRGPGARVIRDA